MNIQRLKEIEALGVLEVSPKELLKYTLIKNSVFTIHEALWEHSISSPHAEVPDPEEALTFAIENLPEHFLTTLLRTHGYQPIKRKQAKRDRALSH